jgi:hypothetical protein
VVGWLLHQGENPYDERSLFLIEKAAGWSQPEAVILWNPPWALAILIPFSFLPFIYAKWIWIAVNGFLILFIGDYWWKASGGKRTISAGILAGLSLVSIGE